MITSPQKLSILAILTAAATLPAGLAHAQSFTGLTSTGSLYSFQAATPGTGTNTPVTGLTTGDALVALDYRPIDGELVALGYNSTAGTARVYTLSIGAGIATATSINANTLTLGAGLSRVTADFNPTANALRIVTSGATGNNLRIPLGGTGALASDTDLSPADNQIRATAYSRNNAGGGTSGATSLYEIFSENPPANQLQIQGSVDFFTGQAGGTSPNTGTHTAVASTNGVTVSSVVGFDIFNAPGTAASAPGSAFLATDTTFYTLNLTNGTATASGNFTGVSLVDLAVVTVPEPGTLALCGVAGAALVVTGLRRRRRMA